MTRKGPTTFDTYDPDAGLDVSPFGNLACLVCRFTRVLPVAILYQILFRLRNNSPSFYAPEGRAMYRIIYKSIETAPLTNTNLKKLLDGARRRNTERAISGILIYHRGAFLQLLEGEVGDVKEIFSRIERDRRHKQITTLLSAEKSGGRAFGQWPMGFIDGDDAGAILRGVADLPDGLNSPKLDRVGAIKILIEVAKVAA